MRSMKSLAFARNVVLHGSMVVVTEPVAVGVCDALAVLESVCVEDELCEVSHVALVVRLWVLVLETE